MSSWSYTKGDVSVVMVANYKGDVSCHARTQKVAFIVVVLYKRGSLLPWSYTKGNVSRHGLINLVVSLIVVYKSSRHGRRINGDTRLHVLMTIIV